MAVTATPLTDAQIEQLDALLAALPPPLEPLDASALDGFLCGVVLQPGTVPESRWLRFVGDLEQGRALPPEVALRITPLVRRRHAELERAVAARQWFDPWVFELAGPETTPRRAVQPWVAGFAAALERFPALLATDEVALIEPLAVLYAAFEAEDLVDAGDLLPVIETLEPPADMAEAVEDLVQSVLRIADVTRPQRRAPQPPSLRARRQPRQGHVK